MKNILYLTILFFGIALNTSAQTVELTPQVGYKFTSTYYDGFNHIRFDGSFVYGGGLYVHFDELAEVGLSVIQQSTTASAYNFISDTTGVKVGITNFHLVGNRAIDPLGSGKFLPYAGLGIGASNFYVRNGQSRLKVSATIQAGTRFQFSDKLGLRVQADLLLPISGIGLGFGIGSGGVSVGANTYSAMIQFGFSAGLGYSF